MRHRLLSAYRPSASDAHLARRAAAGDDDDFEKLYVRYQPRLEAYCRTIVRHDEDARDAVQNAMTKALVALRRDNPANVQGWLFRIAHNEAISLLRRRRPTTELVDVLHDSGLGPAGDLLMREELRATLDGVRALPGRLQHPLLLRELAGLSYGQVAEVVGGTPAAARKAVFDARTALSADRAGRDEACSVIRQSLSEGDGRRRRVRVVRSHLQSCHACCEWESAQRLRRQHLAALLPAASAAGTAGGWLAGLFGGGTTVAAGVGGSLATNAKIAASLAVIAAGAAPVVERVEHGSKPATKISASGAPATEVARAARRAVATATANRAAAEAKVAPAGSTAGTGNARRSTATGATSASDRGASAGERRGPAANRETSPAREKSTAQSRPGSAGPSDASDRGGSPTSRDVSAPRGRPLTSGSAAGTAARSAGADTIPSDAPAGRAASDRGTAPSSGRDPATGGQSPPGSVVAPPAANLAAAPQDAAGYADAG
jgi:RNA polymerase sigma factor (sigma-70 family)